MKLTPREILEEVKRRITAKPEPELLDLLKWAVKHSDECFGDHPSRLQAAETIIAKAEGK